MIAGETEVKPFLGSIRRHAGAFRQVLSHWNTLAPARPRRALDPAALGAAVLPDLALVRVLPGPDFRYDLVGERFREAIPRLRPGALAGGGEEEPGLRDGFIFSRFVDAVTGRTVIGACSTYLDGHGYPRMSVSGFFPLDLGAHGAGSVLVVSWFDREGAPDRDSRTLAERRVRIDDIAGFLDRWAMG